MFGSTNPFGQSSNSPFGTQSVFGQTNNATTNPFAPKPFGSTSPFGSQTGNSIFGGTSTGAFGTTQSSLSSAPAFGASSTPAFGSSMPAFGASSTPAFGSGSSSFGSGWPYFGKDIENVDFLVYRDIGCLWVRVSFGSASAFGQTTSAAFGGTPFGSTSSPFGGQSSPFGAQTTTPTFGSPAFGQSGFGAQRGGSRVAAYTPTAEVDGGTGTQPAEKLESISAMPVYKDKSHEELRWEEYQLGDKGGPNPASQPARGMSFPTPTQSSPFGTTSTFGQTAASPFSSTASPNPFAPKPSPFGATSSSPFGVSSTPAFSSLFGSLFGASTSAAAPSIFRTPSTSAFGASSSPSLFGSSSVPSFTSAASIFGSAPGASSAFGSNTQSSGLFQSSTPSLGQTTSLFGSNFNPSQPASSGFGGNLFGQGTLGQSTMSNPNERNGFISENEIDATPNSSRSQKDVHRKRMSTVWSDFHYVEMNGVGIAICNNCSGVFTGSSSNGTSHLRRHLLSCKKYDPTQLGGHNETECADSHLEFDQQRSIEDLASMIMLHGYPFSIVEHQGFIHYSRNLQPQFQLVSRNTIKGICMGLYEKMKGELYRDLDSLTSHISLTTDMWTSIQTLGYSCLTAHYIDAEWNLQKRLLCFKVEPVPHDGDNLFNSVFKSMIDWNIDRKVFSITVDNDSVNDSLVSKLVGKLGGSLALGARLFHVRCCAHVLNLIVQEGMKVINKDVDKIRESVKYVNESQSRLKAFNDMCRQARIHSNEKLIMDVPTRWNSTYKMLDVALKYKDAFQRLEHLDANYKEKAGAPSWSEWENAEKIFKLLEPFYTATNVFSGYKYPTSNLFFSEVCDIRLHLYEQSITADDILAPLVDKMFGKFEKYWDICSVPLAIAQFLDPQYKMKLMEFFYPKFFGPDVADDQMAKILCDIKALHKEYEAKLPMHSARSQSPICGIASSTSHGTKRVKRFSKFLAESSSSVRKSDLDLYLEEPVFPESDEFDVLQWWKSNAPKYPILAMMARDILAIPVSTVASESAFSVGGRFLDQYRSAMDPETVEALVCGQDWLRNQMQGGKSLGLVEAGVSNINLGSMWIDECAVDDMDASTFAAQQ